MEVTTITGGAEVMKNTGTETGTIGIELKRGGADAERAVARRRLWLWL